MKGMKEVEADVKIGERLLDVVVWLRGLESSKRHVEKATIWRGDVLVGCT